MRGGIFEKNYRINCSDLLSFIKFRNIPIFEKYTKADICDSEYINKVTILEKAREFNDPDLLRLCMEYLPVYFSRRHGDPSRPWNQFTIHIEDENKRKILNYQGNWRDIFQNWEALCISYPEFIGNLIAKFLNASTLDSYNPYRISREGIDWEIIDPDDPWSSIGYWGDHQVIYLLKFLEWNEIFFPSTLQNTLSKEIYCYSNVPYRIKSYREHFEGSLQYYPF